MIYESSGDVAVLDANVLFPFRTRDALLRFAGAKLFHAPGRNRFSTNGVQICSIFIPILNTAWSCRSWTCVDAFPKQSSPDTNN